MTPHDKRLRLAEAWLEKAEGDLETSRAGRDNSRIPAWIIGFHLQQALEKTWKGRLVVLGVRPPAVHDLRVLLQSRVGDTPPAAELVTLIEALQPFAVEERYPLLSPREARASDVAALIPSVEAEIVALRAAIEDAHSRPGRADHPPDQPPARKKGIR